MSASARRRRGYVMLRRWTGPGLTLVKLILGVAALLVAVVIFLKMRSRAPATHESKAPDPAAAARLKNDFHAVSIRPGIFACKAVRELEGQRFLSASVPRIPLPGCDAADCTCRFTHYADRRGGDERRTPYPSSIGLDAGSIGEDKRADDDRRTAPTDPE